MTRSLETARRPERPLPAAPVSFEAFHDWCDEDTWAEWVDGEIILMTPANLEHQRISGFLYEVLNTFVTVHRLGEVFYAPVLMRLRTRPSGREPDLVFVSTAHADRLRPTYIDGPADLVVEIVSPDSEERDRVEKLREYAEAGVPEYWLVDQPRQAASFHQLGPDGRYRLVPVDADGVYHSKVLPGLTLRVAWLWQRPRPAVAEIRAELGA